MILETGELFVAILFVKPFVFGLLIYLLEYLDCFQFCRETDIRMIMNEMYEMYEMKKN